MHRKRFWLFVFPTLLALLPGSIFAQQSVANFTADTTSGCAAFPLVVSFQDLSTGNPTSYFWDFGDPLQPSVSTNQNPRYIYSGAGCFDVTLTVTYADGSSNTLTQECFIELFPDPVPDVALDVSEGCAPLTVQFSDASITNAASNVEWFWSFSNGAVEDVENPIVTFDTPGSYGLRLTVRNSNGCQATADFNDLVNVFEAPELDFTVDVNSACEPPLTATITNTTQTNGATLSYIWQFPNGDPVSSNQENPPPVLYNQVGSFDVTLIATGSCSDTLTRSGFIGVGGVTADFTASSTSICLGEPITFTNTSTGGVNNVEWLFGDGTTSTDNNPTHTFAAPGVYTIELRANNPDGCGDTLINNAFIQVRDVPEANFGVDGQTTCLLPATYTFQDSSVNAIAWSWDFGDGTTSTDQNPTHQYNSFGQFPVTLIVTNAEQCTDTATSQAPIEIIQPEAAFGADMTMGCVPLTVNITDNSITSDSIAFWNWTVSTGDNNDVDTTSTDQNPAFTFDGTGSFHVTLIIETVSGCMDTLELRDYIQAGTKPVSDFIVSKETVCVNDTLSFTSLAAPGDSTWNYSWDFMYMDEFNEMSTLNDPPFAYPDTGTYSVALIVENQGCRDTMIREDLVFVSPPRAEFTVNNPLVCEVPSTVTITDNSIGPITDYEWFLDDVLISTDPDPGMIPIVTIGPHFLKLKVTYSPTGCVDSTEQIIRADNPIADFSSLDLQGCKPYDATFTNASQNIDSYRWFFDEGLTAIDVNPTVTFQDTGFKTVTLIGIARFGCTDTLTRQAYVEVLGPYVNFAANDSAGCPPLDVQFTDLTTPYRNSTITAWSWDFGDPASGAANTSTDQNPSHTYDSTGTYPITLTVTDSDGCTDTRTIPDFIQVTFPEPDFAVDDSISCAGNILNFSDNTAAINTTITSYLWRFGDGETSTEPNPGHAYADTGFFDVTLITTDANGCTDSITKANFIYIEPFNADFTGDPLTSICPPLNASFFNLSTGSISGVNWDFGDNSPNSSILDDTVGHTYIIPGSYDVTLSVVHEDGCVDELTRPDYVEIGGPVGTFDVLPANNVCLGDTVQIRVISTKATSVTADFRDGLVETISAIGDPLAQDTTIFEHVYTNPNCYLPLILLLDDQNCPFEIIDSTAQICVLQPPTAGIGFSDSVACAPFDLGFSDLTIPGDTTIANWAWDFGDGNTSTSPNPVHTYTTPGVYNISLRVNDVIGCADSITTTFEVFPGAVANFVASDSISCAPIDITFTDISTGPAVIAHEWYFGDGFSQDSAFAPSVTHSYFQDSMYTVTMVIFDEVGCSDTLSKTNYINLRHPQAEIQSSALQGCNPVEITFRSTGTVSDTTLAEYQWCLTNPFTGVTNCLNSLNVDSLRFTFTEPGTFDVALVVTDALGCQDTSETITVVISERVIPDPLVMRSVSVESDTSVSVNWNAYPLTDFVSYVVYRIDPNGVATAVDTVRDQLTTSYVDAGGIDTELNVYCYKVLVENTCGEFSNIDLTNEHCTIELTASPGIDEINLDWTPYVGFTVAEYQIYLVTSYADTVSPVLLGTVSGNTLSFTDTATFCRDSITYRILAIDGSGNNEFSYSDISISAPLHEEPTTPVDVFLATVENDTFVNVSWMPYDGYKPDRYLLERSVNGSAWDSLATLPLSTLSFTDTAVNVDAQSYFYRVFAIDSCGDQTPIGAFGRSILLETNRGSNSDGPRLSWNHYAEWPSGVLNYEIEIFNEQTQTWDLVEIVPGTTNSYVDNTTDLNQSGYCYRIRARELGGQSSVSLSNESCVLFSPQVYTPNAFTPNGDGHNDEFKVFVPNVSTNGAELMIFNRWGELIFRTLNLDEGWDGTFKNRSVQEGVYVYVVNGVGVDGTTFTRSGTVTLIR